MQRRIRAGLTGLALGGLAAVTLGFGPLTCDRFAARLSGAEEVPPVDTRARGEAHFTVVVLPEDLLPWMELGDAGPSLPLLDSDSPRIHFHLAVANAPGITQGHVHCGASGVNGPVVVTLVALSPDGAELRALNLRGVIREEDVVAVPDSLECPGGVADLDDLLAKMRAGSAYVNVHTEAHPTGEIRGQLRAVGSPPPGTVPCGPVLVCDATTEICVERGPVGPASVFSCEPVPPGCEQDRSCACAGEVLCEDAFDACHDGGATDTLFCECPLCQ